MQGLAGSSDRRFRDGTVNGEGTSDLNRSGWEAIGASVVSPYLGYQHYRDGLMALIDALPGGGRVLDLGCGPGTIVAKLLADRGFEVVGVDFAEEMIAAARQAVPGATFVCQSMTEISYQAEFDAVVASYSMLCLDPASFGVVAAKIAKALRPGGRCFVALNEAADGEDADAAAMVNIAGQDMYSRAYTEEEVIRLFADMNLLSVGRALVRTEMFGDERSIVFVFGKAGDSVTA